MCTDRLCIYLPEDVVLERRTGFDAYAKPVFSDPQLIRARIERGARVVRNALGQETVSDMAVFCVEPVAPGDRISGREALAVFEMTGRGGETVGYEAAL